MIQTKPVNYSRESIRRVWIYQSAHLRLHEKTALSEMVNISSTQDKTEYSRIIDVDVRVYQHLERLPKNLLGKRSGLGPSHTSKMQFPPPKSQKFLYVR